MLRFRYRASDPAGKIFAGVVEAGDQMAAVRLLNDRGLMVMSLGGGALGFLVNLSKIRPGVGLGELATFTRQMSTMVTAGITITEALSILRDQVSKKFGPIVEQLLVDIESGLSLSASLAKHPRVFSSVYVASVRAGEAGGILDEVLVRLSDGLEKEREFRGKIIGALIYPIIIVIAMVIVAFIMLVFVVPQLSQVFEEFQAQLPLPTRVLLSFSKFASKFWWILVGIIFTGFWAFIIFIRTPFGKNKIDELPFKIPIVGQLTKHIILTEFTRTLGLLVGAGVSIIESLGVVSSITNNEVVARAIKQAATNVEKGFPLAYSLAQERQAFPLMISRMIAVGEETGKLDEVLSKISKILEVESDTQVRALTSAIEPIIMVILGVAVGFLVISIILPIYNLTTQF